MELDCASCKYTSFVFCVYYYMYQEQADTIACSYLYTLLALSSVKKPGTLCKYYIKDVTMTCTENAKHSDAPRLLHALCSLGFTL